MNGEITDEIERFIHAHVTSIEQLEILLLLAGSPGEDWSVPAVSQKLYRQPGSVAAHLKTLRDHGLATESNPGGQAYRYLAGGRHDAVIRGLERAYQVRKDAVIQTVFTRPPESLRAFSNAFRFRRED